MKLFQKTAALLAVLAAVGSPVFAGGTAAHGSIGHGQSHLMLTPIYCDHTENSSLTGGQFFLDGGFSKFVNSHNHLSLNFGKVYGKGDGVLVGGRIDQSQGRSFQSLKFNVSGFTAGQQTPGIFLGYTNSAGNTCFGFADMTNATTTTLSNGSTNAVFDANTSFFSFCGNTTTKLGGVTITALQIITEDSPTNFFVSNVQLNNSPVAPNTSSLPLQYDCTAGTFNIVP